HSWSVAHSPSKVLLDVTSENKKKLHVKRSSFKLKESENIDHLLTEETHSPSDNYRKDIRSDHSQDADFVESVVIIETGLSKTSLPELQRK
ncbi:hypothetical protein ACTXT7_017646, partial [Hymenolepis weldensis]